MDERREAAPSRKPTSADPNAGRTDADRGRPREYPPAPPEESSVIHDERTGQQSDGANTGRVTSPPPQKF